MKKVFLFAVLLALCSCQVGDFEPHRNQLHELNKSDCSQTPERCINGYPWKNVKKKARRTPGLF